MPLTKLNFKSSVISETKLNVIEDPVKPSLAMPMMRRLGEGHFITV